MRLHGIASVAGIAALASLAVCTTAWAAPTKIMLGNHAPYGSYLTDSNGRTVYMFTADKLGTSSCTGTCAKVWPPVLTDGAPTAGSGVTASALGTFKRGDKEQVTYDGMPLYYFIKDTSPGSITGEGINHFGGSWYVISAKGKGILPSGKTVSSSSSSW